MIKIIFNYKPKKELIKYLALVLQFNSKNYLKKHHLPIPPQVDKKVLQKFKKFIKEEVGFRAPLDCLLFNKNLSKKEEMKLNEFLGHYNEIDKIYPTLIKKVKCFKDSLEKTKPEIKNFLDCAQNYIKMNFGVSKIILFPLPYTEGASSLSYGKNFYTLFLARNKNDVKKDRVVHLILHELLHTIDLLSLRKKSPLHLAKKLDKKYRSKHWKYGDFSSIIDESFTEAIELRIIEKREKKLPRYAPEFGKTKFFYNLLKKEYEKNPRYKNIKQFGLAVIRKLLI